MCCGWDWRGREGGKVTEERHVIEELANIETNGPLFPGETISHKTANECVKRDWAGRDISGDLVVTLLGSKILSSIPERGIDPMRTGR